VIPPEINGEPVLGISDSMFMHNTRIKTIILPPALKTIPKWAFYRAIYLEKIIGLETVEQIEDDAFAFTRLKELHFPLLQNLGAGAFEYDACLEIVDIGNTITEIPDKTFYHCANLLKIIGGENITSVGEKSFFATRRLANVPFIEKLTTVGAQAFWHSKCDLSEAVGKSITYNGENTTYLQFGNKIDVRYNSKNE
jgi:hypothetical protein